MAVCLVQTSGADDGEVLQGLGELMDAADAQLVSMEAARYASTRAQAKVLIERHLYHPDIALWCGRAWALQDLHEEVLVAMESISAKVVELRLAR